MQNSPDFSSNSELKSKIFRDRDYFEDVHGDLYQVIGSFHLRGQVFALQKYKRVQSSRANADEILKNLPYNPLEEIRPHKFRLWIQKGTKNYYFRILPNYSSISAQNNIRENSYSQFCSIFQRKMIMVPYSQIIHHWRPEDRLQELTGWMISLSLKKKIMAEKLTQFDNLERECIEMVSSLSAMFKIDLSDMGVTGSILWKGHHPESDIDLMIYGHQNCKKILNSSVLSPSGPFSRKKGVRRYTKLEILPLAQKMSVKSGLPMEECFDYIYHKPYLMFYNERKISLTFAPSYLELPKCPLFTPDSRFISFDVCCVQAQIVSDEWGFDYPGLFNIKVFNILQCPPKFRKDADKITRLLVYEHEFVGFYRSGDKVEIKGMLQRVEQVPDYERPWELIDTYQILVGGVETFGIEYIKRGD